MKWAEVKTLRTETEGFRWIIKIESDMSISKIYVNWNNVKLLSVVTGKQINDLVGADWRNLVNDAGFKFVTFNGTNGEMLLPSTDRSNMPENITLHRFAESIRGVWLQCVENNYLG